MFDVARFFGGVVVEQTQSSVVCTVDSSRGQAARYGPVSAGCGNATVDLSGTELALQWLVVVRK